MEGNLREATSILQRLTRVTEEQNIEIKINEFPNIITKRAVIDVEHDEYGVFVCCGILYVPSKCIYYCSNIHNLYKLINSKLEIIGHNIISDVELLRFWGVRVENSNIYWDTMLIGHIIDSSLKSYGLKDMAKRELGIEYPSYDEIVGKRTSKQKNPRVTLDKQPIEIVSKYNALDVWGTYKLYEKQKTMLKM